ncbi:hypothetical protein [Streptomyces sp. BPSDS2]|uniref:hypothetical protein n=1 Tax=Streptomyces sp. BPSDS2 TaxID=2571021 RepID=UPI0010C1B31D|nr:hypothetical protein [Streptomyces sp. BPSDS2]
MVATGGQDTPEDETAQDPLKQADLDLSVTLLETTRVRALASSPDVYALAELIPPRSQGVAGRVAAFPDFVGLLFMGALGIFGSARKTAAAMADPVYWSLIAEGVGACLGPAESLRLPARGPSRDMWNWHSKRLHPHIPALQERFRELAARQALDAGYASAERPRSLTAPERGQFAVGDGAVVTSPVRDPDRKKTKKKGSNKNKDAEADRSDSSSADADEWVKPRRRDPGAGWHVEGGEEDEGGHPVFGPKFVHTSIRDDRPLSRIILDMRYQPYGKGYGGEAALAVTMLLDAAARLPGLTGACWDGALRGLHRDPLMKTGLLAVSPQHDRIAPRRLTPVTDCPCSQRHDLWSKDGALHEAAILETGEVHLTPMTRIRLEPRGRRRCRWYQLSRLSCGNTHRERLDATEEDRRRGFNRAEHLRQHPPDTDGYTQCYRWRPDAESLNAQLDSTLWNRRMIAYGAPQQTIVMLGFALAQNALTRHLHQRTSSHTDARTA